MTAAPTPVPRHPARRWWTTIGALALVAAVAGAIGYALRGTGSSTPAGPVTGSGTATSETRVLPPFTAVELAGANVVTIAVGAKQSVVVKADDNLIGHVTTTVKHGRLVIGNTRGSFGAKTPVHVAVRVPSLRAVTLSGSGVVNVDGRLRELTVELTGSGLVRATGSATRLDVAVGGSGDAQLAHLAARDVKATIGGSGRILVTASQQLVASITGNGAIVFFGDPDRVMTSVTGSGVISRGQ